MSALCSYGDAQGCVLTKFSPLKFSEKLNYHTRAMISLGLYLLKIHFQTSEDSVVNTTSNICSKLSKHFSLEV
jgi:hypothetical protein